MDNLEPFSAVVARGKFAFVFKAFDRFRKRDVAVKSINCEQLSKTNRASVVEAATAEILVLATLKHQNIVEMYGSLTTLNQYHIIFEYCSGGNLLAYVTAQGGLLEPEARNYLHQLTDALAFTHASGYIHRDVTLENILIADSNVLKLADWGLSGKWSPTTMQTAAYGCLSYSSPEICAGKPYVGKAAFIPAHT
jgi:serine/threonine protein kinase